MSEYSTAVKVEGGEPFKGMAAVSVEPAKLAEKITSTRKIEGYVKEAGGNKVSIMIGKEEGVLIIELKDRVNPKVWMPWDYAGITIGVREIDSSGMGELQGGSLEMLVAPRRDA